MPEGNSPDHNSGFCQQPDMCPRPDTDPPAADAAQVALQLAAGLEQRGCQYAFGGALALGFWGTPRGTIDVYLTLFLPPDQPTRCVHLLQELGCQVQASAAVASLLQHGFCRVTCQGLPVDVFLPTMPFYEQARKRRRCVTLGGRPVMIWDAETLAVFKMMFFRRRDLADVEDILRVQGRDLDRAWIGKQLMEICGESDPRSRQWKELTSQKDG